MGLDSGIALPAPGDVILAPGSGTGAVNLSLHPDAPQFVMSSDAEALDFARGYASSALVAIWRKQSDGFRLIDNFRRRSASTNRLEPSSFPRAREVGAHGSV